MSVKSLNSKATAEHLEYTLVTGASSGIGEAVARRLGASRALILHGRDEQRLEAIRSSFLTPEGHLVWNQDLNDPAETSASLVALLASSGGTICSMAHCAGYFRILPVTAADPASVLRLFTVNFFSATTIIRTLLSRPVNGSALRSILFLSSISSRFGAKEFGIYAATKGALDSLMRSLATELAPAVRVNSILSGGIRTPGTQFLYDVDTEDRMDKGCLLGAGQPDDIAAMADYLLSRDARWITGQEFVVDGGKTAH
jgi:NAD(P)-dependent dehydrogenase (short-subunit alcohol dehydrogenase family)